VLNENENYTEGLRRWRKAAKKPGARTPRKYFLVLRMPVAVGFCSFAEWESYMVSVLI